MYVAAARRHDDNLMQRLTGVALYIWRFKQFTESRWTTVGDSCRTLCAAISMGLFGLLTYIRAQPKTSEYYIHGVDRLTTQVKAFAGVAAIAAYVPDGFLRELLEDDRVVRRRTELEEGLVGELGYVALLSISVWERLSSVLGGAGPVQMRSDAIRAVNVAAAYITRKVATPVR